MRRNLQAILGGLLITAISIADTFSQQIDYKGFPEWSWQKQGETEYYLYTPTNLKAGEKYPIVLFMHGCCGEDNHATLRNAVDPPIRMWHSFGANTQRIPTYLISPKTRRGWSQHIENLKAVMDDLVQNHQGDPQRIYVTGFSMGGQGTWSFISKYPEYFAAALPMGMDFRGDADIVKDVPVWTNRGETDWYARHLGSKVAEIRELNGGPADSSNWVTGVNPRITTFEGVGHGVQWVAASTQDLVGWAYSKVNDGNKYPTVFFTSPAYKHEVTEGATVPVKVEATDKDGRIDKVEVYLNGKRVETLKGNKLSTTIKAPKGDSKIEAIAYDDKGKTATATTVVRVNIPVTIAAQKLASANQGEYFVQKLNAVGNGTVSYTLNDSAQLAEGLQLLNNGTIKGIPVKDGSYAFSVTATDENGDTSERAISLEVKKKKPGTVVVTHAKSYAGKTFGVSEVRIGEMPHSDRNEDEVTISQVGEYKGLTLIQTHANDTINATPYYMEFEVDEDVIVYVAYEKLDNLFTSTVPDWLKGYRKESGDQIVAQYFYYDVYSKEFPKGKITLPDAEEKKNGVNTNYFVMVRKR
jgi:predicted esterase